MENPHPELLVVLLTLVVAHGAAAADNLGSGVELFRRQIRPLLVKRCWECHGVKEQEAGLRLDSREALLRGGQTGSAMVPGEPQQSLLIEAVQYENADFQMPPDGRLLQRDIKALRQWIRVGAPWPDDPGVFSSGTAEPQAPENAKH